MNLWTLAVLSKRLLSQLCKSFFIEDFIVVYDLFVVIIIFGFKFVLVLVFSFVLTLVFNFNSILVFVFLVAGFPLGCVLFMHP